MVFLYYKMKGKEKKEKKKERKNWNDFLFYGWIEL